MSKILRHMKAGAVIQPNPVREGLVLWYDFIGMRNTSADKGIAYDWSGNGNHGTLQNFAYNEVSGYQDKGVAFDNVDDYVAPDLAERFETFTIHSTVYFNGNDGAMIWGGNPSAFYLRRNLGHALHGSVFTSTQESTTVSNIFTAGEASLINVGMMVDGEKLEQHFIVNGKIVHTKQLSGTKATLFRLTHVGTWPTLDYPNLEGTMYSFHMYNRILSPVEIAQNYAIEKQRYNL